MCLKTSECTIQLHCFQHSLGRSNYRIRQQQNAPLHPTLIKSKHVYCFSHWRFKYRFKQCHNARISVRVFRFFLHFQIVSNTVTIHNLPSLFSFFSQFQIINTPRMHALEALFSYIYLRFQIVPNTIRMHALEALFSYIYLRFQIVSNTTRMHAIQDIFRGGHVPGPPKSIVPTH